MGFCTDCGNKIEDNYRFCNSCGHPVKPTTESNMSEDSSPNLNDFNPASEKITTDSFRQINYEDTIDKKTLFDDGMLVLSSKDLILYTSDEKDELKRITLSSIKSCGYSSIRRGLLVKRRINEEENFQSMLANKHSGFSDLKLKKNNFENTLKNTRQRVERQNIKEKIMKIEKDIARLGYEIRELESNPTKIKLAQNQVADIEKELFKLPKSFEGNENVSLKENYKIWEYAINRRMNEISKIKIETLPYDAVVVINNTVFGTTPLTIDKPLIDDAILSGKYSIKLYKEGHETIDFSLSTDLKKKSFIEKFTMSKRTKIDSSMDEQVKELRQRVPDKSIDLSLYGVEREVVGVNEILLLTRDEILVMSKNKEQCLFEIPYGSINFAKYDKGFLRGSKAVKINYNETHYPNHEFDFWVDDDFGKISASELKQRSQSLCEILNRKNKESKIMDIPNRIRSPNYYIVNERDIQNNFSRFEPFEFERLIAKLFEKKGYKSSVTQKTGDYGIDVIAEAGNEKIAIQVKHWQASVGGPDVHKTLGSMMTYGATRAMVITSSDFTNQAYEIQKMGAPVELWNGSRLRDEFRQYLLDAINEAKNNKN